MAVLTLGIAFFNTAWVAEDAYITFRVVENTWNGFGPVWNTDERVQAYTHPLWLALLLAARILTDDNYSSSIVLSGAALALTIWMAWQSLEKSKLTLCALIALLVSSRAFVDFSTSGLENPLTHALLAFSISLFLRTSMDAKTVSLRSWQPLLLVLIFLVRPDAILLVLPLALLEASTLWHAQHPRSIAWPVTAAALLLLGWFAFSLFYYGSPVPNTAIAKLGSPTLFVDTASAALDYWRASLTADSPTVLTIMLALAAVVLLGSDREKVVALGVVAWSGYLLFTGGDYMRGRMLSAPFFISALILVRIAQRNNVAKFVVAGVTIIGLLTTFSFTVFSPKTYADYVIDPAGIADERGYYFQFTGLRQRIKNSEFWRSHPFARIGETVREQDASIYVVCWAGMAGYLAGPRAKIIDPYALTEPLLARLPAKDNARIGHFERSVPDGFLHWRLYGEADKLPPALRALANDVRLATRAPLLEPERFGAILRLIIFRPAQISRMAFDHNNIGLPESGLRRPAASPTTCLGQQGIFFAAYSLDPIAGTSLRLFPSARLRPFLAASK